MKHHYILICSLLTFTTFAQEKANSSWPQWRGPDGTGVSKEKGWLTTFGDNGPVKLWEAKVGRGFSAPVIRDGLLYLMSVDGSNLQRETVWCFDAETGKERWQHTYDLASIKRGTNPAGGTPAIVGDLLFTYGAGLTLVCTDINTGKPTWTKDLMKELPCQPTPYGYQLSPLPYDNLVIVPAIASAEKKVAMPINEPRGGPYPVNGGMILAYDQKTGKEIWRNTEGASAWSSPMLATFDGKKTLVHLTGRYLLGVDPANGKTLWKSDLREVGIVAEDMAASPLIVGDLIVAPIHKAFGSVSKGTAGSAAFRIQDGKPKLVWKNLEWCHWFQPAAVWGNAMYGYDERNTFWCIDLATGKDKWKSKEFGTSGSNGGAIMIADGKVLAIDARQNLTIADVSPEGPKILTQIRIFNQQSGYECETAPLLLDGKLYCRNHTQLVCFDLRPKSK